MKNFRALFFAVLSFLSIFAASDFTFAQELPPSVFLNKITYRLVGRWPYPHEFEALKRELQSKNCNSVNCSESFFRNYIREKMDQPEFYALAYANVTERMGYKSPSSSSLKEILAQARAANGPTAVSIGRDFALIYRVFKQNLSVDELYTSQIVDDPIYQTIDVANSSYDRFSIDPSAARSKGIATGSSKITLDDGSTVEATQFDMTGHPNISGLFSSTRFIHRFWNTSENSGRKRASSFFRLMMCDFMSPALERESEKEKERRIAMGLSPDNVADEELKRIHENLPPDRHATQKDCAACHDRLDPIAKSMRGMEVGISSEAFGGRLRYFDTFGERTNIEAKSFHDLVRKTTEQPKFLDCQISWLLRSYLGKNLELAPQRIVELTNAVEKNKRRIKSTIEEMLMMPEFRGIKIKFEEPKAYTHSKEILSNCTDCHTNFFKEHPAQIRGKLVRIATCLDLKSDGRARTMPPSSHWWHPSEDELKSIKSWIESGAPMGGELKLFNGNEVRKVFSPEGPVRKCRE